MGREPTAGVLRPAGQMSVPRAVHTATTLRDGRVLIAGGCTTDGCDLGSAGGATAEIFDPATGRFSPTGRLSVSRDDHIAVPLADGRVVLIGGWGAAGLLASTDIYTPETGTFTRGPDMHTPRAGMMPVTLRDGRILVARSHREPAHHRRIGASRPTCGRLTATGAMVQARGAYAAARLPDGRVLIAGGLNEGTVVATAEVFDPTTGTFARTGSMRVPRYKGAALPLPDGAVLIVGGSADIDGSRVYASSEIYHPETGTFTDGPTMRDARYKIADASAILGEGDVLIGGGAPRPELFRARTATFVPVDGDLGATRLFLAAAPLGGRRVLLVGGYDKAIRPTAAAWIYDADHGGQSTKD